MRDHGGGRPSHALGTALAEGGVHRRIFGRQIGRSGARKTKRTMRTSDDMGIGIFGEAPS